MLYTRTYTRPDALVNEPTSLTFYLFMFRNNLLSNFFYRKTVSEMLCVP